MINNDVAQKLQSSRLFLRLLSCLDLNLDGFCLDFPCRFLTCNITMTSQKWGSFWVKLGRFWVDFGLILGRFWVGFWVAFGSVLGRFLVDFVWILGCCIWLKHTALEHSVH